MTTQPTLTVHELSKSFGPVVAVDRLSFSVEPGRVTGLLGPNGSGKTTTLRMLVGLVTPTGGAARIEGLPYRDLVQPIRTVGAALEASGFHPGRTARDHLRIVATQSGIATSRVDEVLEQTGIADDAHRKVGGFSLGMRQRLALASALLGDPHILLLDEPANGLDPSGIAWLRDFLRWRASQGGTVLVSSHVLAEVSQTVDDVVIISDGRLVVQSSLDTLLAGTEAAVRVVTPSSQALSIVLQSRGMRVETVDATTLVVKDGTAAEVGEIAAQERLALHQLVDEQRDLEEVFLRLVERGEQ
jgi:ABC-2 type transport system ATP-binding protein